MWIELQYSKGHSYVRLVENTNTFDEETQKKKRSRRVVKSIGPLAHSMTDSQIVYGGYGNLSGAANLSLIA